MDFLLLRIGYGAQHNLSRPTPHHEPDVIGDDVVAERL